MYSLSGEALMMRYHHVQQFARYYIRGCLFINVPAVGLSLSLSLVTADKMSSASAASASLCNAVLMNQVTVGAQGSISTAGGGDGGSVKNWRCQLLSHR